MKPATLLTTKAQAIRARLEDTPMKIEPPRTDTYDFEKNKKIWDELDRLQKRSQLETYLVMWGETPVAIIVFKNTDAQCTCIVTKMVNGQRVMWKSSVRGHNYDRRTEVLSGLTLPSVHSEYERDHSPRHFVMRNEGVRWDTYLLNNGFKVWRTL